MFVGGNTGLFCYSVMHTTFPKIFRKVDPFFKLNILYLGLTNLLLYKLINSYFQSTFNRKNVWCLILRNNFRTNLIIFVKVHTNVPFRSMNNTNMSAVEIVLTLLNVRLFNFVW